MGVSVKWKVSAMKREENFLTSFWLMLTIAIFILRRPEVAIFADIFY